MKNYIKLLVVVFALPLAFTSCKDDENAGSSLIGTWEEVSFVSSGCVDPADNETFSCTSSCERIVVTENTVKFDNDPVISYSINGNQITLTETSGSISITITVMYEVNGNTLIITQQDSASDGGCKNVSTYQRV